MATAVGDIEVLIKGDAAKGIESLQRITGKDQPVDVIIAALRVYEWILAQQAKGNAIAVISKNGKEEIKQEVVDYIKNKDAAFEFFKGRDIFEL